MNSSSGLPDSTRERAGKNITPAPRRTRRAVLPRLLLCLLSLAALLPAAPGQEAQPEFKTMPAPALPYFDWKACPFEGCGYGRWTARKATTAYDTWKATRRSIATLAAGDKVTAVTGVVITYRPGIIRLDRDLPAQGLRRGDTIRVYTYQGEGFARVWFQGRFYSDFDISFTKWPDGSGCNGAYCAATFVSMAKQAWWAQVRLQSGRLGWVDMDHAEFDGVDALGG